MINYLCHHFFVTKDIILGVSDLYTVNENLTNNESVNVLCLTLIIFQTNCLRITCHRAIGLWDEHIKVTDQWEIELKIAHRCGVNIFNIDN